MVIHGDFEWDETKAATNVAKHRVSFEEATTVFDDVDYLLNRDVVDPTRFVAVGFSAAARILVVVHVEAAERLRVISARCATLTEERLYAERQGP